MGDGRAWMTDGGATRRAGVYDGCAAFRQAHPDARRLRTNEANWTLAGRGLGGSQHARLVGFWETAAAISRHVRSAAGRGSRVGDNCTTGVILDGGCADLVVRSP